MGILRQISGLARHSAIYAISTAIQKLPGFLLLPIYTSLNYLPSRSDFGDYAIVFTFIAFMHYFYTYGMDAAMLRYFFLGKQDRKIVFSSTFLILILTSLGTTAILILLSPTLAEWLLQGSRYAGFIRLAGWILLFDAIGNLPYLILRAEEKSLQYTLFRGFRFLLELGFNILFVVVLRTGVIGILYTALAASLINLVVMIPIIKRYLTRRVDLTLWREMLKFGLPFLPNGIAFTTIELVDRFIVPAVLGKDALGLYAANYKFGVVLLLLIVAFRNAWQPFFLKIAHQEDARQVYSRVLTYFTIGGGLIVLSGTFFIRDLLTVHYLGRVYILGPHYWEGIPIIPLILLSYFFFGIYVILTPGFYIKKKSQYMVLFTGAGALINVAVNLWLLPVLGIMGAALATLASYLTMAGTIFFFSHRIFPLRIEWSRVGQMLALIALGMGLHYGWHPSLGIRIALMAGILLYCLLVVLRPEERQAAVAQWQRR